MRLQGLGDEFVFDEISASCEILFLTTLVNLEAFELPERLPKIYTSKNLQAQFLHYFQSQGKELDSENLHVLRPFEAVPLGFSNGDALEVLPCMPEDASTSFMLAFRKGLRITHFYAGFASDISTTLVNTTFAKWLRASGESVDNLYIMNHTSTERCVDCEFESAFENLQQQLQDENIAKILVRVPLFGCEVFIAHLASEYRGELAIDRFVYDVFAKTPKAEMKYFINDFENATIVLSNTDLPLEPDCSIETTVEEYDVKWSPLPEFFELDLLTRLLQPKNILHISDINSYKIMQTPAVHIKKYLFKNEMPTANTLSANDRDISTKKCCCPKTSISHTNYIDCMKSLVIESTNPYCHGDIIESSSNSDNETLGRSRILPTPKRRGNRAFRSRPHQKTLHSSVSKGLLSNEQPTTSSAARNMSSNKYYQKSDSANNPRKTLNCPATNNLIYRKGKRGLCFEDDSSSD